MKYYIPQSQDIGVYAVQFTGENIDQINDLLDHIRVSKKDYDISFTLGAYAVIRENDKKEYHVRVKDYICLIPPTANSLVKIMVLEKNLFDYLFKEYIPISEEKVGAQV